jgi:peptide/nickel transport system ATP-binding protein
MMSTEEGLLIASNLRVEYPLGKSSKKCALDNVSLTILGNGSTMGLVGESGSGKTTLGMSLLRMIKVPGKLTAEKIQYDGTDVMRMSDKALRVYRGEGVSMIFQSASNSLNPVKRASDHIVETLRNHEHGISKSEALERARNLLEEVELLPEHFDDFPHEMSSGMKQRVAIALSLCLSPKIVIADEPTSALDVVVQKQILKLLKHEVETRKLSLLYITHDLPILAGLVDEISIMWAGEIVEKGPTSRILLDPLHPYTEELVSSILVLDPTFQIGKRETRPELGQLGSSSKKSIPSVGCKFQNRCKYVMERCRREAPTLKDLEKGREVACHKYG